MGQETAKPPEKDATPEMLLDLMRANSVARTVIIQVIYYRWDNSYLADVLNALAALQRHPQVNPQRIGMWGHSMGGYITLRSMVITDDIKAGVIWAGVVASYPDLLRRWRRGTGATVTPTPSPRSWRFSLVEQYGSPEENPELWNSISANSYLGDLSGPIPVTPWNRGCRCAACIFRTPVLPDARCTAVRGAL